LRQRLDRIIPSRRERPVRFRLPTLSTADDAVTAMAAIVKAVADGELTPGEAGEIAALYGQNDRDHRARSSRARFGETSGEQP
jgi:hypothetical protein